MIASSSLNGEGFAAFVDESFEFVILHHYEHRYPIGHCLMLSFNPGQGFAAVDK